MSETLTIDLPERAVREIELAARAAGQTPEQFVAAAAAQRARALVDAKAFFTERAKGADLDAFDRVLNRQGGEPPQPGDEVD